VPPLACSSASTGSLAATSVTSRRSAKASPSCGLATAPVYRVDYLQDGDELILLLCGGDKSAQDDDIKNAKRIAKQ
jgi:hypothetical protein